MNTMDDWTHAWYMLSWLAGARIKRVDLLVKRTSGVAIPHRAVSICHVPVPWLNAENDRGAEIYIRTTRGESWPLVFLDDVETNLACRIAQRYDALVVLTSTAGGCHIWLKTTYSLDEQERGQVQRWLAQRAHADRASTSGEHLGRLAGMRNWKRQGVWVNVIRTDSGRRLRWDPTLALREMRELQRLPTGQHAASCPKRESGMPDKSESAKEWGWVCGSLEAGAHPETVFHLLYKHALPRRGRDAERYARRTVQRAIEKVL